MADDDFTEDFDEALPEEFQDEEPVRAPLRPAQRGRPAPAPAQRAPPQRQAVHAQAPASAPIKTQEVQYVPFSLPARVGIYDNFAGKPMMEDPDKLDLILGAVTELLNRVANIEKNL